MLTCSVCHNRMSGLLDQWRASPECGVMTRTCESPLRVTGFTIKSYVVESASFGRQTLLLARRAWWHQLRSPLMLRAQAGQIIFMAILVGLIYLRMDNDQTSSQDRQGSLFFVVVDAIMSTTMGVLSIFASEKQVFNREYGAGLYGLPAYFISRNLVEVSSLPSFRI
jgi:hypothetical protein